MSDLNENTPPIAPLGEFERRGELTTPRFNAGRDGHPALSVDEKYGPVVETTIWVGYRVETRRPEEAAGWIATIAARGLRENEIQQAMPRVRGIEVRKLGEQPTNWTKPQAEPFSTWRERMEKEMIAATARHSPKAMTSGPVDPTNTGSAASPSASTDDSPKASFSWDPMPAGDLVGGSPTPPPASSSPPSETPDPLS
jgi:hypothetical protein